MKKTILFSLLLINSLASIGQESNQPLQVKKEIYSKRSERQKTVGTILLASSPVLILAPILIQPKKAGNATMGIYYTAIAAGFLAIPTSIGFFIASGSNRKKANRLSFKNETMPQWTGQNLTSRPTLSLSLKISL